MNCLFIAENKLSLLDELLSEVERGDFILVFLKHKIFSLFLCFSVFFCFCSCNFFDNLEEIDSDDFNLPVSCEYDLLFLSPIRDEKDELNKLFHEYELETGVKIKNFSPNFGQSYKDLLKTQINSKEKPALFFIQDEFEFNFWEKEECLLNFSKSLRQEIKDLNSTLDKQLMFNFNTKDTLCIPCFLDSYGYLIDIKILENLLFEPEIDKFLEDFRSCSFDEFENFVKILSGYIKTPKNLSFKLNKNNYKLKEKKEGKASNLKAVFSPKINFDNCLDASLSAVFKDFYSLQSLSQSQMESLKKALVSYAELLNLEMSNMIFTKNYDTLLKEENKEEAIKNFTNSESLFLQGGTNDLKTIKKISHEFKDSLRLLPIKTPFISENKTNNFLPVFSTNYVAINSKISEKEKKMAEDFLIWFFTSNKSKKIILEEVQKIPLDFSDEIKTNDFFSYIINQKKLKNIFPSSCYKLSSDWYESFINFHDLKKYFEKQNLKKEDYNKFADFTMKIIKDIN